MARLLITITHSTEAPERAAGALASALGLLEGGHEVALWLTAEGVRLAVQHVAETLREPYPQTAAEMMEALAAGGARFHADRASFAMRGFAEDQLRTGAQVDDAAALGALVDAGFTPVHV